ncbi:MAG: fibronectin type III domain-containing protein [Candidatus Saccharimonadales bacterium]
MPATIVQQKTHIQNSATSTVTVILDAPAVAGNELIIVFAGDAYVSSGAIPAGFSEPDGARQERYLGHYVWHKTAVGGEKTITFSPQVACSHVWAIYEINGLSGVGSMVASAGQGVGPGASSSVYSTPNLTLTAGERFILASVGGTTTQTFTALGSWTNSYTQLAEIKTAVGGGGTNDSMGVATRSLTANSNDVTSTAATWDGGLSPDSRTSIIVAFNIGGADVTPPTIPGGVRITKRRDTSLVVGWSASTDGVAVKGYDVVVNGVSVGKTSSLTRKVTGLTPLTTYIVAVRAYDTADNYSALSTAITTATVEGSGKYYWSGSSRHLLNPRVIDPSTHYSTLPRVPWEGGPSYYDQFTGMSGTEWTNDAFFPIGYWGAYADQKFYIDRYKELDINLVWSTYNNVSQSAGWLRDAGIWNLGGAIQNSGSEHVGYVVEDEVDMWAGAGWGGWTGATGFVSNVCTSGGADCGYTVMQQTEAAFPQDGRLRWTNVGMTIFTYQEGTGDAYVNGMTPQGSWPMHLVTTDMYFYTGSGAIVVDAESNFGIPAVAVRRAGNYGEVLMTKLREYDGMQGGRKPLGVIVELGGQIPGGEEMDADKVEGAVWSTLIHEARCISYFSHVFVDSTNNPYSTNALYSSGGLYPSIQARVKKINSEVLSLAPVLNTQSYQWQGSDDIQSMLKIKDGFAYLFTMAKVAPVHSTVPRTFVLPFGITGKTAEVLFESRTIDVTQGAIHDTYALETTYHIYKIAL